MNCTSVVRELPRGVQVVVFICAAVTADSLRTTAVAEPDLSGLSAADLQTVVIRLDRERCYGSCPVYTLTIAGNGEVAFDGRAWVKVIGKAKGQISEKAVRTLLAAFDAADFLSIGDTLTAKKCSCAFWTDFPTVITELQIGRVTHRVERYAGCGCKADTLVALEKQIDAVAGVVKWTGDTKGGPFGWSRIR